MSNHYNLDAITHQLDFDGKKSRQRKVRMIRWDSNERLPTDKMLLETTFGYTLDTLRLPVGDFSWDIRPEAWLHAVLGYEIMVVERKSLADLRDVARLRSQLDRLVKIDGALSVLLIDQRFDRDRERRWREGAVLNAALSVQFTGVKVTHCAEGSLAERLDELYQWSQKRHHVLTGGVE